MSQAQPKRTIYDDAMEAELARWPRVTWKRVVRGKHYAMNLTFGGVTRLHTYPSTPSDSRRGQQRQIRDLKESLRDLGATREVQRKATGPKRRQNRTTPSVIDLGERAVRDPSRDPFAGLAQLRRDLVDATPFVLPIRNSHRPWWKKLWSRP